MQRWGLTGGIASGKSTVAKMLRELGIAVIEADLISHRLMELGGAAYEPVVKLFGRAILDSDGDVADGIPIARSRVAAIVFNERKKLEELNAIIHPLVEQELAREFAFLESNGKVAVAFVEAALIYEAGLDKKLDGVAVVWCLPEQQMARLKERGMSEANARKRMGTQMPVAEKLARADVKIDCSGTVEETRRQVAELTAELKQKSGA
jgi:dephospho-CoA kinase